LGSAFSALSVSFWEVFLITEKLVFRAEKDA